MLPYSSHATAALLSQPATAGCKAHAKSRRLPLNQGLAAVPMPVSALRQDVLRPEQSGFARNRSACDSRRRLLSARCCVIRQGREWLVWALAFSLWVTMGE